ncbi:MAG: hypothetical protein LBV03_10030 [Fusobacteriales bacterium]|nr:hypothetical protein [Fusobacteriales bacterium]
MGMGKIEKLIKSYVENPNEEDNLMMVSEILGLSTGEMSCCRGMLAELSHDGAKNTKIISNLLEKRSENTIRNDRKRYHLYLSTSETGKKLVLKLSIEKIKIMLWLEKKDVEQYEEVLKLLNTDGMTKEALYNYLDGNVKKEESLYIKNNEVLKPIMDFVKKVKRIGAEKFSESMNGVIKNVGIQLLDTLSIWEKVPNVQEFKKILGNKPKYLDISTGIYI